MTDGIVIGGRPILHGFSAGRDSNYSNYPTESFSSKKRDANFIEIDPKYEPQFIPEHNVDRRRWPKNMSRGGNAPNNLEGVVWIFRDGKLFRFDSYTDCKETHGDFAPNRLSGRVKNKPESWALRDADFDSENFDPDEWEEYRPVVYEQKK